MRRKFLARKEPDPADQALFILLEEYIEEGRTYTGTWCGSALRQYCNYSPMHKKVVKKL
jgi:hypothetical protein